ncbi:hypothetical protein HQ576_03275, partial [bacterium]|nr:hypothetical protein [bacterium]
VLAQVFKHDQPVQYGGTKGQMVQLGRVAVNRRNANVSVGISEFPQFPQCRQITTQAGANSGARGQVVTGPQRPAAAAGQRLPFDPPKAQPGTALVVTNYTALQRNHPGEFAQLKAYLEGLGTVLDTSNEGKDEAAIQQRIRDAVRRDSKTAVFIFGNADVVPFKKRENPCYHPKDDDDVIFGDDFYGDLDDDPLMLPDIDVGRIPDDPAIIRNPQSALYKPAESSKPLQRMELASVSNFRRPSSALIVDQINPVVENQNIFWCMPHDTASLPPDLYRDRSVFIVLHGALSRDYAHRYRGEDKDSNPANNPVGIQVDAVQPAEVVWSAACYGGHVVGKTAKTSVALAFLAKGCRTFVGFSGSHYSSPSTVTTGGQLLCKLFLDEIKNGFPPSTAFRLAKHSFSKQLDDNKDKKDLIEAVYYGIPALQPVTIQKTEPPKPTPTPKPIAIAAQVPAAEPPALPATFSGSRIDPAQWEIPKAGQKYGSWQVKGGALQVHAHGTPPPNPVPILATPPSRPFTGDWTVAVRVPHFTFRGTGRYGFHFHMMTASKTHAFQHGLIHSTDWNDGLWRSVHGTGKNFERQPLEKMIRAVTLVMKKTGKVVSYYLNQRKVHSIQLATAPTEPFFLTLSHGWTPGVDARVHVDYVYLFGKRGGPAPTPPPAKTTTPIPPPTKTTPGTRPNPLHLIVTRYFETYQREDVAALRALFHPQSAFLKTSAASLRSTFQTYNYRYTVRHITVDSSNATDARVTAMVMSSERKGNMIWTPSLHKNHRFVLKKAGGEWKIVSCGTGSQGAPPPAAGTKKAPSGQADRAALTAFPPKLFSALQKEDAAALAALFDPNSYNRDNQLKREQSDFRFFDRTYQISRIRINDLRGDKADVRVYVTRRQKMRTSKDWNTVRHEVGLGMRKVGGKWLLVSYGVRGFWSP